MFEFNGHTITNPFMDETRRFEVDPRDYYGFRPVNMGGCCEAWSKDNILLTDHTGCNPPTDSGKWLMGKYDDEGELIDTIEEF